MPKARVIRVERGVYWVQEENSGGLFSATLPGKLKNDQKITHSIVNVGDWVEISLKNNSGIIDSVLPRKNKISRVDPGNRNGERIVAANIDRLVIVTSVRNPSLNLRLVDRYLLIAGRNEIEPVIIISKLDLLGKNDNTLEQIKERFKYAETDIKFFSRYSARTGEELADIFRGNTSAVVGSSGVGKSTLIKYLAPETDIRIGEVSESSYKGKHTTTSVRMYYLKSLDAYIVDTPGIREFGIYGMEAEEVAHYFPEFKRYEGKCRFYNCTHVHEPGCVVKENVDSGNIHPDRYISYLNIIESIQNETQRY
jgi:ribosome biogenesis GTPase